MEKLNDQNEKDLVGKTKDELTALQNKNGLISDEELDNVTGGRYEYTSTGNPPITGVTPQR